MLDFSSLDAWNICLGTLPGFTFGLLMGYWGENVARARRGPNGEYQRGDGPLVNAARRMLAYRPEAPFAPIANLAVAIGNAARAARTEPVEHGNAVAPGLNEYGEVVDARVLGRRQ